VSFFLFSCTLPFIFDAAGLLPRHILKQDDPPWITVHTSKTQQHEHIRHQKGKNRHNQVETSPSGLIQGRATLPLKGTRQEPEPECQFTLRARILRTQESTSTSANSAEKERSGQLGPGYLHIVTSHHQSGWTRWPMKERRMSAPVNPSWSKL
jgi:hypothetical protein